MPDYQADSVLDTCQSFIDMGKENYLVSTFDERIASLDLLPVSYTHLTLPTT